MRALTPWGGVGTFRHEMERVFDRFVEPRWEEFEAGGDWQPRVDLAETKDAVVVKAEIPGVDQKDIQVTLQGELLTIKGQKQQQKEEKDEHYTGSSDPMALLPARSGCPGPWMGPR